MNKNEKYVAISLKFQLRVARRGFFCVCVCAQLLWNKALKPVGRVILGPGRLWDEFPTGISPALGNTDPARGPTCAADTQPHGPSSCSPAGTRSQHLHGEQGPGPRGAR